jgi:hypothetical protein
MLEHIATAGTKVIVGMICCNCCEPIMTSYHIIPTLALDTIVAFAVPFK